MYVSCMNIFKKFLVLLHSGVSMVKQISMRMPTAILKELKTLKAVPQEPYWHVIRRLIEFYKKHHEGGDSK